MSNKTAILERPNNRATARAPRFDSRPLTTELAEDEAEDTFEQEPGDELLQIYENSILPAEDTFQDDPHEAVVSSTLNDEEEEIGAAAVAVLLADDDHPSRTDESLQVWMSRARGAQLLTADE